MRKSVVELERPAKVFFLEGCLVHFDLTPDHKRIIIGISIDLGFSIPVSV